MRRHGFDDTALTAGPDIPGAQDVVAWFGYWPTFHDAEVISLCLQRSEVSSIAIHTWHRTTETDERGYYICVKHVVLTFSFRGFLDEPEIRISFFNHQNVLFGAEVVAIPGGHVLELDGIFGVTGAIACKELRVALQPGVPEDSGYRTQTRPVS